MRRGETRRKQCFKDERLRKVTWYNQYEVGLAVGRNEVEGCSPRYQVFKGTKGNVIVVGVCYFCHPSSIYSISVQRSLIPSGEISPSSTAETMGGYNFSGK